MQTTNTLTKTKHLIKPFSSNFNPHHTTPTPPRLTLYSYTISATLEQQYSYTNYYSNSNLDTIDTG